MEGEMTRFVELSMDDTYAAYRCERISGLHTFYPEDKLLSQLLGLNLCFPLASLTLGLPGRPVRTIMCQIYKVLEHFGQRKSSGKSPMNASKLRYVFCPSSFPHVEPPKIKHRCTTSTLIHI